MTLLRIGHGGASALAPANTLESFDAAAEVGIDMIEFDVRATAAGELVLAHTLLDLRRPGVVRLGAALRHLAAPRFAQIGLNVDLKRLGPEPALLEALRSAGLLSRTLISSQVPAIVDHVRALEPRVRVGISVGGQLARASRRWGDRRVDALRRLDAGRGGWQAGVLAGLEAGRWDALMVQHRLIDPPLLASVRERRGAVYAWTVNDRALIESLQRLGVDGITTADPRLFRPSV